MGSDLKHGFISSLRSAWQTLNEFARAHTSSALQAELAIVANQIEEEEKHVQEGEFPPMCDLSLDLYLYCEVDNLVLVRRRA